VKSSFLYSFATCGFKRTGKPDLAIIYSPIPCIYVGVFTKNQVRAACVDENKNLLNKKQKIKAIVVNSGNANACTGKKGINAVKQTKEIAAKLLKIKPNEVLVASTGVIGVHLDIEKMKKGLVHAVPKLNTSNFKNAARAILTTDRYLKAIKKKTKDFSISGFTKGAGMIHPNMATMLCYFMTDINAPQSMLQSALKSAVENSFNLISVDGDMSTNDMVILLSNCQSKKKIVKNNDPVFLNFQKILNEQCLKLAKEIVADGEGANKVITVHVNGVKSKKDANEIARSIASSNLFKCAIFGSDPNWGRAAARIGATNVNVNQNKISISINKTLVFKNGTPVEFNKSKLNREIKRSKEVMLTINLKLGKESGMAFGCDLSFDYVKLNSAYFT
jgi:glutamate N-acetyltransferase/amino-acid N-acetyltransferase